MVDRAQRVIILTVADFVRRRDGPPRRSGRAAAPPLSRPRQHAQRQARWWARSRRGRCAWPTRAEPLLAELVPLFADGGHHHIPIVGDEARLVGIITQSDLVTALAQGSEPIV